MLAVISPAKNLDYQTPTPTSAYTEPQMLAHTQQLVEQCRHLSPAELSSLMGISDKLALLNAQRFADFCLPFSPANARQALFAFNGDVYAGLQAYDLDERDIEYAQQHLRILSGLYGVLRPLDLMQAYRLEMGTKLTTERGKTLYAFWGDSITQVLNEALQQQGDDILVNLASQEYFSAVKPNAIQGQIITPVFKDWKAGQYKVISFYAKKARGMMVRYLTQSRVRDWQQLTAFNLGGYRFSPEQSTPEAPVFLRDHPEES